MLHEFLIANRDELISRCRLRANARRMPEIANGEFELAIPAFLTQLTHVLREESSGLKDTRMALSELPSNCFEGFSLDGVALGQMVHDYADVFQVVAELSVEMGSPISTDELLVFNRCLGDAIAEVVSAFQHKQERLLADAAERILGERLGFLAHEFRNLTNTSILALEGIRRTSAALTGPSAAILDRSLLSMRDLCARALTEARQQAAAPESRERVLVSDFMREVQSSAVAEAEVRGLDLVVPSVDPGLMIDIDRQILGRVVANLLQNAFKFSRPKSRVLLRALSSADRVLIEIEDECGGLPDGASESLFRPFEQQGSDRSGVGLGLAISRAGVEFNGGTIQVRNLPGRGCVFTIDLPDPKKRGLEKTSRQSQETASA